MPFGLTNAPATFQRLMDKIITPDLKPNVFCYLDDIIILTENFEEHLKNLEIVLEKINQAGLTINLEKCEFGCSEVKYLGFIVNEKRLLMDEDKIKPILEFLTPKNVKQLQRIIGMTSWYRRFIPKFSEIMEPLHTLLKKGVEWKWNAKQEQALEKIKKLPTTGPILACPNFHHPFQLETDASDTGLGAMSTQNIYNNNHSQVEASTKQRENIQLQKKSA